MQTDIPPLSGTRPVRVAPSIITPELREEMLAILRESHPRRSPLPPIKAELARPAEDFPDAKPRTKAIEVWNGSVCVRIYPMKWRDSRRRKTYRKYELRWIDAGKRFRQKKSRLDEAKKLAELIAGAISTGETNRLQFGQADIASFFRCREILGSMESRLQPAASLEVAISHFADWIKKLGSAAAVDHALQFFQEHQPKDVAPKNIPELADQMIADKRRNGRGNKWLKELEALLKFWSEKFNGPIHAYRGHEISARLDEIGPCGRAVSLRTRKNRLAAFRELVRFAQAKGQLSRTWKELDDVDDPELPPVEVEIYTPKQIARLLAVTRPNMIPFTVLQAFAGIRHEELASPARAGTKALLDWRDINFEKSMIRIKKTVGKTKKQRLIEMQPNLVAWLKPYARISGRICELGHTSNALVRAKQRAGIPAGRGELTNALRSSFISYRLAQTDNIGLVAREAGNSPKMIEEHYLELVSKAESALWFDLWPPAGADIIQMPLPGL